MNEMILKVSNQFDYDYNKNANRLEKRALDISKQYNSMMLLRRGIENTMVHRVNEITENFMESNGEIKNEFKFYYSSNT
jgi:hypothetical protein